MSVSIGWVITAVDGPSLSEIVRSLFSVAQPPSWAGHLTVPLRFSSLQKWTIRGLCRRTFSVVLKKVSCKFSNYPAYETESLAPLPASEATFTGKGVWNPKLGNLGIVLTLLSAVCDLEYMVCLSDLFSSDTKGEVRLEVSEVLF